MSSISYSYHELYRDKLLSIDPKYFITLTFRKNTPKESFFTSIDVDSGHFLKMLHQNLFGNNFYRKNRLFNFAIIRELHDSGKDHCHILIGDHPDINFKNLTKSFWKASYKVDSIKSIKINELGILTYPHYKNNPALFTMKKYGVTQIFYDDYPLNLQEITEKENVVEYVLKDCWKNQFPIHISKKGGTPKENYFHINTNEYK